jgi:DNA-binding NarL/FixJ family response regulator
MDEQYDKPIRVLLADDHELVRAGFRALLQKLKLQVVAEASDGNEAVRLIGVHRPEVVLMDIAMPGLNGLDATGRIALEFPKVKVIILSVHANVEYARRALRVGAAGYLLKNSRLPELALAIQAATNNEIYLSPAVARFVAADYAPGPQGEAASLERLSHREREILELLAKGFTRKQIAEKLMISPKTFDTYRAQLMDELDIHDVAGLVRYATRMGLLTPDE